MMQYHALPLIILTSHHDRLLHVICHSLKFFNDARLFAFGGIQGRIIREVDVDASQLIKSWLKVLHKMFLQTDSDFIE